MNAAEAVDTSTPRIAVRPATEPDLAFVYATWLRSYRNHSDFARRIPPRIFFDRHHAVVERIVARGAEVLIAHPEGDEDQILGYLVTERLGEVVHFAYVKRVFRRMGVARTLLEAVNLPKTYAYTHHTDDADVLLKRVSGGVYDPYLI